jgi:hypothetical protein
MKPFLSFTLLVLFLASCTQQGPTPLTDAEKAAIQTEIRQAVNTMVQGAQSLDADSAFVIFSDSPEFYSIGMDGSAADYKSIYGANKEFFGSCSQLKFTPIQDDLRFLSNDLVLYAWIYSADADLKSGEHYSYDKVGATFLFKKLQNRWITVYFHESGLPPAITKGKK